jgi:nucleotide-binding universal stress UspA family protein
MTPVVFGRTGVSAPGRARPAAARPVVLATFDAPFAAEATELAVDASVEAGQGLIVVNVSPVALMPASMAMGYTYIESAEMRAALRAPAELAASLNVAVELLRVSSPHPADALLELVSERNPGLLVLGPDLARVRRRVYRKAVKRVRERTSCLVWLADED